MICKTNGRCNIMTRDSFLRCHVYLLQLLLGYFHVRQCHDMREGVGDLYTR